jgi:hypothetical protein
VIQKLLKTSSRSNESFLLDPPPSIVSKKLCNNRVDLTEVWIATSSITAEIVQRPLERLLNGSLEFLNGKQIIRFEVNHKITSKRRTEVGLPN